MSRVFPQLASGALAQYPLRIREQVRTLFNQTPDGRRIRYSDGGASTIEWDLFHSALSDGEMAAIESLFVDCEGRRHSFLFLDPWANLLKASESFADSPWTAGPGLGLSEGANDPEDRPRATQVTNVSGSLQSLSQNIPVPSEFQYSLSIYARASSPTQLRLIVATDGAFAERLFDLSPEWQRYSLFSSLAVANDFVEVAMQLPAGATVELFGAQLEAQPAPSPYQRTALRTGLYPDSRFAGDTLTQVSTSPGEHSTVIRIISRVPLDA
jgi:hypothetical protein